MSTESRLRVCRTHTPNTFHDIPSLPLLRVLYYSSLGRYGFTLELGWLHKTVIVYHSFSDSSVQLHVEYFGAARFLSETSVTLHFFSI